MIVTSEYELARVAAPSLPSPPPEYDARYGEQLNNILRLYFNRLNNALGQLRVQAFTDGSSLRLPNGAFYQDGYTTLTANMSNTSTAPIQVVSTAGFTSAGCLFIGSELISYTGKTATTFTGITRGALGSTNVSHNIGDYISEAQPVPSPTTAVALVMTNTDASNQVALDAVDKSKVVYSVPGYYNIQFSVQLLSCDNQIDNVTLWFRKNGADIANTAGIVSVPAIHAGGPGVAIVSWNLIVNAQAGDYTQLLMASNSGNTVCCTYPPGTGPVHPASPSVILTSTFVSALTT